MNDELIRRLAEQAGAKIFPTVMVVADGGSSGRATEFIPRLIELIVVEVIDKIESVGFKSSNDIPFEITDLFVGQIKQHFGVE